MTSEMKTPTWHTMEGDAAIQELDTRLEGLSASDVKEAVALSRSGVDYYCW